MSILRNSAVAVLVAGAALAVPSAAFASTASPAAPAAASASTSVHTVPCTTQTFNVYHGAKETCYAGYGGEKLNYADVYRIDTGRYTGCIQSGYHLAPPGTGWSKPFVPHTTLRYDPKFVGVGSFALTDLPPLCKP